MAQRDGFKKSRRLRRHQHIRKHIRGSAERPRLSVFRSHHHIYAQLIDDINGVTLAAASTLTPDLRDALAKTGSKTERAKLVGEHIAELAQKSKISKVVFDRAGYLYHGRIKALAEGAREKGLNF